MADTEAMLERMEAIERRNAELEAENEVLRGHQEPTWSFWEWGGRCGLYDPAGGFIPVVS